MPKRCQEIRQIKIHHTKTANLCGFGYCKIQKKLEKRYSNVVRVVEPLVQAVCLRALSNL